eukprot:366150-Chlamydomonas_euryale.AAC.1
MGAHSPLTPTRVGVEQRHNDRHVGAADGCGQVPAEHARDCRDRHQRCNCSIRRRRRQERAGRHDRRREHAGVEQVPAGERQRRRVHDAVQLPKRDERARQRQRADPVAQHRGHLCHTVDRENVHRGQCLTPPT